MQQSHTTWHYAQFCSGMPTELLSISPEGALQWCWTERKELSQLVISLRHADGTLVRVRPFSFFMTAEIGLKRRLVVTFE